MVVRDRQFVEIRKHIKDIDADAARKIYLSIGWGDGSTYGDRDIKHSIESTQFVYTLWRGGQLIGFAKLFSDDVIQSYLAEIVVHAKYQGSGYGKMLMHEIVNDFSHTAIYLEALEQNVQFFESCGLKVAKSLVAMSRKKIN